MFSTGYGMNVATANYDVIAAGHEMVDISCYELELLSMTFTKETR